MVDKAAEQATNRAFHECKVLDGSMSLLEFVSVRVRRGGKKELHALSSPGTAEKL